LHQQQRYWHQRSGNTGGDDRDAAQAALPLPAFCV
jgi:hypothetical protein